MSDEHRAVLRRNAVKLKDTDINGVLRMLKQETKIPADVFERIRHAGPRCDQVDKLLEELPSYGEAAFFAFIKALREGSKQGFLADLLEDKKPPLVIDKG